MPDEKISEVATLNNPTTTGSIFPIVDNGQTYKITIDDLTTFINTQYFSTKNIRGKFKNHTGQFTITGDSNFYLIEGTGFLRKIVGGNYTTHIATATNAGILAGTANIVSGSNSLIGGGQSNTVRGQWSFIGGGLSNDTWDDYANIVGGSNNLASGSRSFVGGGQSNLAYGLRTFIGGGQSNIAVVIEPVL